MKKFIPILALITIFVVVAFYSFTPPPPAFNNMAIVGFTIDTLTNTESDTLTFTHNFDYPSQLTWTLNNTEISGTATSVWKVEQSAYSSGTANWILTDTMATVTATGTHSYTLTNRPAYSGQNELFGYRIRFIGVNSGTGVHRYNVNTIARTLPK